MERKERRKRIRFFLVGLVMRPLLFAAWCFVLWGTLLAVLVPFKALEVGVDGALRAAFGGGGGLYAWGNAVAIALAIVVWPTVVWMRVLAGKHASRSGTRGDA